MDVDADLYDRDFLAWTQAQAERLRAAANTRSNLPIDWEHVAEEIEDLGKRERRDLESRLQTIVEHLLKLEFSPARAPRGGWAETVARSRKEVQKLLRQSPSLRHELEQMILEAGNDARDVVRASLREHSEADAMARVLAAGKHTPEQVLGDWWPEGPAAAP
ncbi:MAG TPA: DUF29 domain-containing protein [Acidisphaera sp.]|nr:DUF29 domain-containing protein [Acidisphaera sp.]